MRVANYICCFPSQASVLWDKYKDSMSDDILYCIWIADQDSTIDFLPEIYKQALIKIEDICILISNIPLIHFGMPSLNRPPTDIINSVIQREQQFDTISLTTFVENNEQLLNDDQKNVYDRINLSIATEQGGFFFWTHQVS